MTANFSNITFLSILKLILILFLIRLPLYLIYLEVTPFNSKAAIPHSLTPSPPLTLFVFSSNHKRGTGAPPVAANQAKGLAHLISLLGKGWRGINSGVLGAYMAKALKGCLYTSESLATFYISTTLSLPLMPHVSCVAVRAPIGWRGSVGTGGALLDVEVKAGAKGSREEYGQDNFSRVNFASVWACLENTIKEVEIKVSDSVILREPLKSLMVFEALITKEEVVNTKTFQSRSDGMSGHNITAALAAHAPFPRYSAIGRAEERKGLEDKRAYSTISGNGLNDNILSQNNQNFSKTETFRTGWASTEGLGISKKKISNILERKSLNEILEGLLELNAKEIALLNFLQDETEPNIRTFKYISSNFKYKIVIQINSRNNLFKDPHYKLVYQMCLYVHSNNQWKFKNRKVWGETHLSYNSFKLEKSIALGSCSLDEIWENPGDVIIRGVFKDSYLKNGKISLRLNRIVLLGKADNAREWEGFFKEGYGLESLCASHVIINDGPFNFKSEQDKGKTPAFAILSSQIPNGCEAIPMSSIPLNRCAGARAGAGGTRFASHPYKAGHPTLPSLYESLAQQPKRVALRSANAREGMRTPFLLPSNDSKQGESARTPKGLASGGSYFIFPSVVLHTKMLADLAMLPVLKYNRYIMGLKRYSPFFTASNHNHKDIRKREGIGSGDPMLESGAIDNRLSKLYRYLNGKACSETERYLGTLLWINLKNKKPILIFVSHICAKILTWSPETEKGRDHTIFTFLTELLLRQTLDIGEVLTKTSQSTNTFKLIVPRYKETVNLSGHRNFLLESQAGEPEIKYIYDSAFIKTLSEITPYKFEALDWKDPNMPKLIKYVHKQMSSNNPSELIQTAIDKCNNKLKKKIKVLNLNIVKRQGPKKKIKES